MLAGGRNCFEPLPFFSSLSVLLMAFQAWKLQPMNQPRDTVYWQRILSNYPYSSGMSQMLDLNQTTSDSGSHTQRLQADGSEQVSWVYLKVVLIHGKISVEALHAITLFYHNTSIFQTFCLIERRVLVICQCPREDYPLVILKIYFINRFPKQNLEKQLQWNLVCSINVTVIHSDLNN